MISGAGNLAGGRRSGDRVRRREGRWAGAAGGRMGRWAAHCLPLHAIARPLHVHCTSHCTPHCTSHNAKGKRQILYKQQKRTQIPPHHSFRVSIIVHSAYVFIACNGTCNGRAMGVQWACNGVHHTHTHKPTCTLANNGRPIRRLAARPAGRLASQAAHTVHRIAMATQLSA